MTLKCRQCKKKVDVSAEYCPYCNEKYPTGTPLETALGLVMMAVLLYGAWAVFFADEEVSASAESTTVSVQPQKDMASESGLPETSKKIATQEGWLDFDSSQVTSAKVPRSGNQKK